MGKKKTPVEKEKTKVTQRKPQYCGIPLTSWLACSCSTVGKKEHVLCLSHWFHSGTMTWICRAPGTRAFRRVSAVVALLKAQEFLEKYLLGTWGRSLHCSEEVHSSVGVLIRRHLDDKHDTKIQAFVIFLAVTCYNKRWIFMFGLFNTGFVALFSIIINLDKFVFSFHQNRNLTLI